MEWTLVTGASKGLGQRVCLDMAAKGSPVVVHYRTSKAEANDVALSCRKLGVMAEMIYGDFTTARGVNEFILECRRSAPLIKNLINNVGTYLVKPASLTTTEEWQAIFQTNLYTPFALSHAFLETITITQGNIINIGVAGVGVLKSDTYATAYMAAKTGLLSLTKSLAKELAPEGVRVNMVSPGYMENSIDLPSDSTSLPMRRAVFFSEVSRVVVDLLDNKSCSITGQNIEIAGGVRL